ncbi:hypothetical protein OG417_06455 [Actinoallomurus sp. NBC_01490]|nr:hypothetical protein [Actinoallomurus sp. NBC_01490]
MMSAWLIGSATPSALAIVASWNIGSGEMARSQPPRCWSNRSTVTSFSRGSAVVDSPSSVATWSVSFSFSSWTSRSTAVAVTGLEMLAMRNSEVAGW